MAKSDRNETAIKKVDPSFLAQYEDQDKSLVGMEEYRVLPRVKIIQGMTIKELRDRFPEGTAIVRPGDLVLCAPQKSGEAMKPDNVFSFVPLFFFPEFCKWRDIRDKDGPMVVQRSFDRESVLRKRADNQDTRFEIYAADENKLLDKPRRFRYVHHLRFAGVVYGNHPCAGTPVVISFERGEYGNGVNFVTAARMRRQKIEVDGTERLVKVPLWAQVWKFATGWRPRAEGGGWYGFNYGPPDPAVDGHGSLISAKESEDFFKLHKELADLYEQQRIRVDEVDPVEEADGDPAEVAASAEF